MAAKSNRRSVACGRDIQGGGWLHKEERKELKERRRETGREKMARLSSISFDKGGHRRVRHRTTCLHRQRLSFPRASLAAPSPVFRHDSLIEEADQFMGGLFENDRWSASAPPNATRRRYTFTLFFVSYFSGDASLSNEPEEILRE